MSLVEDRLAKAGMTVPPPATPAGAYVPALKHGGYVFTSGKLPMVNGELICAGKVGDGDGAVTPDEAAELAKVCALNALAAIKSVVGDLDKVERIVKLVGYVASDPSFTGQPLVINGASEVFAQAFGDAGLHVRASVGVASLPLNSPIEIEVTAAVTD